MRKLIFPTIATLIALAILLNLGFWQLNRLAWKEALIDRVKAGVSSPPVSAPGPTEWMTLSEDDDYRRVEVNGAFQKGSAYYYTALTDPVGAIGGPGLMVYVPFKSDEGWTVFINRGFLPQGLDDNLRAEALDLPEGEVTLTGLLRLSEKPNWTTPEPDENDLIWFARDTASMAELLGVDATGLAPYSVDLDAAFTPAAGMPQAGETIVRFKNDHLGYALTWFGLAATLVGVYLTWAASVLWPRKRRDSA